MIRFKIDSDCTEILDRITSIYNFKRDTITARIALALSFGKGKIFLEQESSLPQNGREYTPTSNIFGNLVNDTDNYPIYKAIFDQHYGQELSEVEFIRLYKLHLRDGLVQWINDLEKVDITNGGHISLLLRPIKNGLILRNTDVKIASGNTQTKIVKEYTSLLSFELGQDENGDIIEIRLNDTREFDNRNMAIAGMAGSGKTQLIKDILYQITKNSNFELKFIFFDYKGEGNVSQLKPFLDATRCDFVDIVKDNGVKFNPFLSISMEERQRPFSIKAFVDTIATFLPGLGIPQKNILTNIITELFDRSNGTYPDLHELLAAIQEYYESNNRKADTLSAGIQDLATNIFNCDINNESILDKSLYLNLPPALSDTLRQLVVFLLLRYFSTYFSSTNDCEIVDHIFPLRYVIVIDEAHIYLKNRNARKALEELLRLLRSKGVIIVMLSQGVEDYKTKDFDFASQVKLPICLNVQNKDYKAISSFLGTPISRYKLEAEIKKLEKEKGLIQIGEPKTITLRQWWKTRNEENI
jgi:DNA sulfur modification protein DndE